MNAKDTAILLLCSFSDHFEPRVGKRAQDIEERGFYLRFDTESRADFY
jgi:hypothetical protein